MSKEPSHDGADPYDVAGVTAGAEPAATKEESAPEAPKKSVATRLVELALGRYELGCTPDGESYAIPVTAPRIVRQLRGGRGSLRAELARAYYTSTGHAASQSALADALMVIEGEAQRVAPVELHLRVAAHHAALILDLGDPTGRAVAITCAGWRIVDEPPVRFRRTAATGALPVPLRGGNLSALWNAVNVAKRYRPLVFAVLVAELIPDLPHPVVAITGEGGTGKSTATRRLASIIDPSPAQLRKAPRDVETWTTAAVGSWVVALDNLSGVPDWLSDALCRASTGDGDLRRRLYTDGDLHVIAFRRATMLNGIDLGALRGDLADRLVHILLDVISPDQRRLDATLDTDWRRAHPLVLGAVLDLTVKVLAALPGIHLRELPRMADYARVLAAVDKVLGTDGLTTYRGLADDLAHDVVTSDPVLIALAKSVHEERTVTSTELLAVITPYDVHGRAPKDWPKARTLTAVLRRQASALRRLGWTVEEIPRDSTGYKVLRWRLKPPPQPPGAVAGQGREANDADNADNAEYGGKPAGHGAAAVSANPSATARQPVGVAEHSANVAETANYADPYAETTTPTLNSKNGSHSANSATSAVSSHLLGSTCVGCGQRLFLIEPGREQCEACRLGSAS